MLRAAADGLGLIAVLALVGIIAWPYWARRRRAGPQPHFWLGYALAPAALIHGWAAMQSGEARGASVAGMSLATLALLPLAAQIWVGPILRRSTRASRATTRRLHFGIMAVAALLVTVHLVLVRW